MTHSIGAKFLGGAAVVGGTILAVGGTFFACVGAAGSLIDKTDGTLSILQDNSSWQRKVCAVISTLGFVLAAWKFKSAALLLLSNVTVLGVAGAFSVAGSSFGVALLSVAVAIAGFALRPKY